MLAIKKYLIGMAVGLVLGLWFGVNLGKEKPIWSNPFAQRSLAEAAKSKADAIIKDAKRAVRESLDEKN